MVPLHALNKIEINQLVTNIFRIQDNESIMTGFYFIALTEYILAGKNLLDYTNLFSLNDYKKSEKKYTNILKTNMVEKVSLEFRLRKINETRNYLLDEIKHNDLMSEKYDETCKYLNYAKHLLSLNNCRLCFNFCICFISLCSCRYYEFCSRNKHLCNHCGN